MSLSSIKAMTQSFIFNQGCTTEMPQEEYTLQSHLFVDVGVPFIFLRRITIRPLKWGSTCLVKFKLLLEQNFSYLLF